MIDKKEYELERAKQDVQQNPIHHGSWVLLGRAHESTGNYAAAMRCYEKAFSLNPRDNEDYSVDTDIFIYWNLRTVHEKLGQLNLVQDDVDALRELYKEKERMMANTARNWNDLAGDYGMIHDKDEAIRCLEQAITLDAGDSFKWRDLGSLYRNKGDLDKSKHCYEVAIEVNWSSDQYHKESFAIELWHSLGEIDDALGNAGEAEHCRQQEQEMQAARDAHKTEFQRDWSLNAVAPEQEIELMDEEKQVLDELARQIGEPIPRIRADDYIPYDAFGYVSSKGHVTMLGLDKKSITTIPDEIGRLSSLKVLDLNSNAITKLPDAICDLSTQMHSCLMVIPWTFSRIR